MIESLRAFVARPGVIAILRMTLFSVYGLVIIGQDIVNYGNHENISLWVVDVVLWALLLIDYIRRIRHAENRRAFVLSNLGYPIFLLTGALIPIDHPWLVALPLILGYALQVRELAAGHVLVFSSALVMFILAISSLLLYLVERNQPNTDFTSPSSTFSWAIARLFRIYGTNTGAPVSAQGQEIAFVMGVAAIVAAGLFTGQLIRWLVRADEKKDSDASDAVSANPTADDVASLTAEMAAMSEQLRKVTELLERLQSGDPARASEPDKEA